MKNYYLLPFSFLLTFSILVSCKKNNDDDNPQPPVVNDPLCAENPNIVDVIGIEDPNIATWLVPENEVFDGGPGQDGIPSVDDPVFVSDFSNATLSYLKDNDLVVGVKVGDDVRAYPHPVLDWHEIVNDEIEALPLAITYCPLTGTAIGWNRLVNGQETEFGVSGLLYNTNLIPYDRNSGSRWSQMGLKSVNGDLKGQDIQTHHLVETTWKTWKDLYPNSKVLNDNTGFNRPYGDYPYVNNNGDYRLADYLIFPINFSDDRLPPKDRVLGVIVDGTARIYTFDKFDFQTVDVVEDVFNGQEIVVAGSKDKNFLVAFNQILDGTKLSFEAVQDELPVVMQDNEGNKWTLFGQAVEGPRSGQHLENLPSYIGYYFAWATFYPEVCIY